MNIVITGAAGFIGSHLSEALLKRGHTVIGIDDLEHTTNRNIKEDNLKNILGHPQFQWNSTDLLKIDLDHLINNADVIFHLAGIAGVRNSWGLSFNDYLQANVLLTQKILEACKKSARLKKIVYASSSSVYGGGSGPFSSEESPTRPISPYGLTKLAGEHLCSLYYKQYGLPYTALRYFTVYGPRQRPDMGFHRFMKAAILDQPLTIYGNGQQTRDFTYISDLVEGNIQAMNYKNHGTVFNIGGVETASVNEVITTIERLSGKKLQLSYLPEQPGDPFTTRGDISFARNELGYHPIISLDEGMTEQWAYISGLYGNEVASPK
ncbi:NAD-dependent epimerase/dehydratase family protein [Paenibacillus crassostreae]|uniref:UDP-glucose 4-epimerase n=1 Tax=Paenibacillus crassostreae TaxID=1763538 RepID=A0A167ED08_9BACL|nr:NAD-dependent epimerase/dehydratase family protein [Paenibacillus crassostreae]AOZ91960.1 UDP-glucose 4-epimerase [Paenibacillus crassostreae]OAB75409.1 UDP-glucose 4-epimerase [Paenibacillus crassostreae]